MKYGKIALIVAGCAIMTRTLSPVAALEEYEAPYVALGMDLTADEEKSIIRDLGVSREHITEDTAIYVSMEDIDRHLGLEIAPDSRADRSVVSCAVVRGELGSGIRVSSMNIDGVTDDMMRNSFVTVGMRDAEIRLASPVAVSGTEALYGVTGAWSKMNGYAIDPDAIITAARELLFSIGLGRDLGDDGLASALIAEAKKFVIDNNIKDREDILKVITDTADRLGIKVSDDDIEELLDLLENIVKLDLEPEQA